MNRYILIALGLLAACATLPDDPPCQNGSYYWKDGTSDGPGDCDGEG